MNQSLQAKQLDINKLRQKYDNLKTKLKNQFRKMLEAHKLSNQSMSSGDHQLIS